MILCVCVFVFFSFGAQSSRFNHAGFRLNETLLIVITRHQTSNLSSAKRGVATSFRNLPSLESSQSRYCWKENSQSIFIQYSVNMQLSIFEVLYNIYIYIFFFNNNVHFPSVCFGTNVTSVSDSFQKDLGLLPETNLERSHLTATAGTGLAGHMIHMPACDTAHHFQFPRFFAVATTTDTQRLPMSRSGSLFLFFIFFYFFHPAG